ncbi:amidophosphoribosyltransferase [Parabacteroides sp. PF5-5]|uniref:amidophosphoribosyltransferase n=1 Tax=unclassified Parabacteroides TaxID=2649774 RepID=UPI00247564B4|nr:MULTISPECIES: amidophosphoribosyltransferase [unclassified Parabacteroides]MDH6305780.1 amidophosphoribosyltransferase [Parabacteroides sp. PH5-39]MDH6317783.1 amidophosphoribosyltransferase [Parabacteroides sp. PF5-13]MDH6320614.1 amidophosphoribosyltransferase [Parabacteroides sp. PH5-13]MDH6324223.1 amidophosphoribosyltransferase [Parabacteroides sp. PH5-8]MDH6328968.1 amidophosphoribosyltransferase [Parabacteroides sp. PH5-41]
MEELKHECGVAMVRLLKPLEYYHQKYGNWMYGLNKLYLLMEKQHNRGQEGAGLACVKLEASAGEEYMFRERAIGTGAITEIFSSVHDHYKDIPKDKLKDPCFAKEHLPFAGELYMGHLRYSTTGKSGISFIHPFLRRNNWRAKNLALCGNFNLTNVQDVFHEITSIGQHPRLYSDTYIMLEQMGHRLDREVERLYQQSEKEGLKGMDITHAIEDQVDMANVLKRCVPAWDGGFVICGLTGSGESFSVRDPWGIRPAFYYADDEIVVLASERPVIQTAMNVRADQVTELNRGEALIIGKNGQLRTSQIVEPERLSACSFERIYFSRGSDVDIYRERKQLGKNLVHPILQSVDYDTNNTVFSFIPNTAEVAYFGLQEGLNDYLNTKKKEWIAGRNSWMDERELEKILSMRVRAEKVAIKDIKLRTFIAEGNTRDDLAAHVYDVTYGSIKRGVDNLVVIDDSIVRGTTLKQSIIGILDRLGPRKIIIVSSSPQVRYPDYYGIDMSRMNEFIAFRAAIALLEDREQVGLIHEVYKKAKTQDSEPGEVMVNYVKEIYAPFTDEEISAKMVDLLTPEGTNAKVEIVYQTLEGLHDACPNHPGDWYFSGDYPTPGGVRMVNKAFIHFMEDEYLHKNGVFIMKN